MNWINLETEAQLNQIIEESFVKPQAIFKHSTTCSISNVVKSRLDRYNNSECPIDFHYLDLLKFRPISNMVASQLEVHHESPQIILIKNGSCVYDESHMAIDIEELFEQ